MYGGFFILIWKLRELLINKLNRKTTILFEEYELKDGYIKRMTYEDKFDRKYCFTGNVAE